MAARSGARNRLAQALTSSRVTAFRSPGSLTSWSIPRPNCSHDSRNVAIAAFVSSSRGIDPTRYFFDASNSSTVTPSAAIRRTSSSIATIVRSTFAGLTPARMTSGPSPRFGSNALNT